MATACFSPRVPDAVDKVAKLCANASVHHVVNNAYGIQCAKTNKLINRSSMVGHVDAISSSTDIMFLVPASKICIMGL
jgi:O-phospho-L-seryl-tRNASec:L-selenocysteinyl-tRNA synthase